MSRSETSFARTVRVGGQVGVRLGDRLVAATVVEQLGAVGVRHQQVVRVIVGDAVNASDPDRLELDVPVERNLSTTLRQ
jgi:hypothetical protein